MGKTLKRLGDELDEAERAVSAMMSADRGNYFFSPDSVPFDEYVAIMKRRHDAEGAYGQAVTERERAKRERFKNRKTPMTSRDGLRLRNERDFAEIRIDEIVAARPDFATMREFIDANAAYIAADAIFDCAQEMYRSQLAIARRDKTSNTVRKFYRRKSNEVHL